MTHDEDQALPHFPLVIDGEQREAVSGRVFATVDPYARQPRATAPEGDGDDVDLAELLLTSETDRAFADTGHSFDFINKAFECLDLIGWEHAATVLPTVVGQMVAARGAEESTAWRQPADLIALCHAMATELPGLFAAGRGGDRWSNHAALARTLRTRLENGRARSSP